MADISQFWEHARVAAKLNPLSEYVGPRVSGTVPPEAWAFGDTPEMSDQLVELVLQGKKTATTGALREYEDAGEPVPEPGQLSIILDGAGRPRALVRDTRVRVCRFDEVDAAHAAAEGEGDGSLEQWRRDHRDYFERTGGFSYEMLVVLEEFELLYPTHWKPL